MTSSQKLTQNDHWYLITEASDQIFYQGAIKPTERSIKLTSRYFLNIVKKKLKLVQQNKIHLLINLLVL